MRRRCPSPLLVEARAGQFGTAQAWRARGVEPRFEDVETLLVRGGNRDWHSDGRRDQAFGTASYFHDRRGGSHHLKAGGKITRWQRRRDARRRLPASRPRGTRRPARGPAERIARRTAA
jgi:hypothetical protein